jgi:uncharacterized protein DUF1330
MKSYYTAAVAATIGIAAGAGAVTVLNAQATPKGYVVTEVETTGDAEVFRRDYLDYVKATVDTFGGRYIVRGGHLVSIEGEPVHGRIIISVFDSAAGGPVAEPPRQPPSGPISSCEWGSVSLLGWLRAARSLVFGPANRK